MDLEKKFVSAPDRHHWSRDSGGVFVRRETLDAGCFQARASKQIFLLILKTSDSDPVFRHG